MKKTEVSKNDTVTRKRQFENDYQLDNQLRQNRTFDFDYQQSTINLADSTQYS